MLTPQQILARLDDSVALLVGANRLAPTRHQTLRGRSTGAMRSCPQRNCEAQALLEHSLRQHEARAEAAPAAWAVFNLAQIANRERGTTESIRLNEDALRRYRALGNVRLVAMLSVLLADDLASLGRLERVPRLLEERLDALEATRDRVFLTTGLLTMATLAAYLGQAVRATTFLGSVESINASEGLTLAPNVRVVYARLESIAAEEALEAGQRMALGEALAEAREMVQLVRVHLHQALSTRAADRTLTRRERMVVRLLLRGLSDREIAGELGIAPSTASVHVRKGLAKLGLRSRWQVQYLPRNKLATYLNDVVDAD